MFYGYLRWHAPREEKTNKTRVKYSFLFFLKPRTRVKQKMMNDDGATMKIAYLHQLISVSLQIKT